MHRYDPIWVFVYTHQPIPIRVLLALMSQPLISLDQAGHLENAAYTQWVAHTQTISNIPTCALSQFEDWFLRRMIESWDCCHHFLLAEGVWRHLSLVAILPPTVPSWCHQDAGIALQPPSSSHLSNPLLYHGQSNGARELGRWRGTNALWSSCNVTC